MKQAEYIGNFLGSRLILVTFSLLLLDTSMKSTHQRKFILPPVTGYHSKSITEGRLGKELKHLIVIAVKNIKKMNTYTLPAYCLCLTTSLLSYILQLQLKKCTTHRELSIHTSINNQDNTPQSCPCVNLA